MSDFSLNESEDEENITGNDTFFCYYATWATYRSGNGKVDIENIDPHLCTHVIYTFVGLQPTGEVKIIDSWHDYSLNGLNRFINLKKQNPSLKLLLAMGGWNEGSTTYSNVANSPSLRSAMATNVVNFCKTYGFDGFDLDWEYPGQRGGAASDRVAFIELLKELRTKLEREGLILTTAVGASAHFITSSYNAAEMVKYVNYILLMTYDLRSAYDGVTGQNSPLYSSPKESSSVATYNMHSAVNAWIQAGATASQLVLGIPLYGKSFTLASASNNGLGARSSGPGPKGPYTDEPGTLNYIEVCEKLIQGGWTTVWDDDQKVPYSYKGTEWIGYDNAESVKGKTEYAKSRGLGGVMIYSLEQDDVYGACGGGKYPLMNSIKSALSGSSGGGGTTTTTTTQKPGQTTSSTTTTSTSTTTTTSAPPPSGSLCQSVGSVRDPNNCSIYYVCEKNPAGGYKQTQFDCKTLCFDTAKNVCNWCYSVSC
ncbi:chitinase-3-like protein 1 [Phlebotomus argentipes]|uniref:chitinase-3-like protein 1 n=1 Tax=Phlebotomus argentipes TaxID=94469 RepID=UPI0028934C83|nr:chitinase-3-like protein 1 [Phlebotomus argentipes]